MERSDSEAELAELRAENARLRALLGLNGPSEARPPFYGATFDAVDYEAYANGRRPMNRYEKLFAASVQEQATVDARQYSYQVMDEDTRDRLPGGKLHLMKAARDSALQASRYAPLDAGWVDGVLCGRTPKDDHGEGEG
jgi:hypothetical protein